MGAPTNILFPLLLATETYSIVMSCVCKYVVEFKQHHAFSSQCSPNALDRHVMNCDRLSNGETLPISACIAFSRWLEPHRFSILFFLLLPFVVVCHVQACSLRPFVFIHITGWQVHSRMFSYVTERTFSFLSIDKFYLCIHEQCSVKVAAYSPYTSTMLPKCWMLNVFRFGRVAARSCMLSMAGHHFPSCLTVPLDSSLA